MNKTLKTILITLGALVALVIIAGVIKFNFSDSDIVLSEESKEVVEQGNLDESQTVDTKWCSGDDYWRRIFGPDVEKHIAALNVESLNVELIDNVLTYKHHDYLFDEEETVYGYEIYEDLERVIVVTVKSDMSDWVTINKFPKECQFFIKSNLYILDTDSKSINELYELDNNTDSSIDGWFLLDDTKIIVDRTDDSWKFIDIVDLTTYDKNVLGKGRCSPRGVSKGPYEDRYYILTAVCYEEGVHILIDTLENKVLRNGAPIYFAQGEHLLGFFNGVVPIAGYDLKTSKDDADPERYFISLYNLETQEEKEIWSSILRGEGSEFYEDGKTYFEIDPKVVTYNAESDTLVINFSAGNFNPESSLEFELTYSFEDGSVSMNRAVVEN